MPKQSIPSSVLLIVHHADGATANRRHGLKYFCYDKVSATLDELLSQTPIYSGEAAGFDIVLSQPKEYVAMQFQGLIEIPQTGEYVFSTLSDDPNELYIGNLKPKIVVISSNSPPAARVLAIPQPASLSQRLRMGRHRR